MQFLAGIVVFCPLISALAYIAPRATPVANAIMLHPQGWSPRPTEPPKFIELLKRQSSGSLTLIEGPDPVCGYQFGSFNGALGLCGTSTCGFATAQGQDGEIVCYGPTTSHARPPWTSCIGGTIGAASCLADPVCSNNPAIAICTVSTESYCNVGTFIGLGVEAIWCDSTYNSGSMIPISTTYSGQLGRTLTNPNGSTQPSTSNTPVTFSSTTSTPITTTPSKSVTPTTPTATPTSQSKSSTPAGPIVGGVIGGLALIAAIVAGIFICLRLKRKDEQTTTGFSGPPAVQTYTQDNNTHPQYEKYPTSAEATFIPPRFPPTQAKPEQEIHHQQPPPRPQHQQHPPVVQTSYNVYQPPQQQFPLRTGNYMEEQQPVQQTQQHYPQNSQAPSHSPPVQPPSHELSDTHRGSVASARSAPRSPAPPYTSTTPTVPEMTSEPSHYVHPIENQY